MEKEACAVVEAIRNWAHLLGGRRFTVVTDQAQVNRHAVCLCYNNSKVKRPRNYAKSSTLLHGTMPACAIKIELLRKLSKQNN